MRSEVYRSTPVVRELFIWLLLNVGWQTKDTEKDDVGVGRGEWKGTLDDIRKGLSWKSGYRTEMYTKAQIQRALVKLNGYNTVEYTGDTRGISVKVCKYDTYQGSRNTGRNTSETPPKRLRNADENVKDISYNNKIYNKDISLNKDKEKEEVEEEAYSPNKAFQILKIVEPVFGNLADPFYGMGGISVWGPRVWEAIRTYSFDSVQIACEALVKLKMEGKVEVNNPDVFFKKGLPGYIVRAKNETAETVKQIEKKQWKGFCVECDGTKVFPSKPNGYEPCDHCGDESFYMSEFDYKHEKSIRNPKPRVEPEDRYKDVRGDENFEAVQNFLRGFGNGNNNR